MPPPVISALFLPGSSAMSQPIPPVPYTTTPLTATTLPTYAPQAAGIPLQAAVRLFGAAGLSTPAEEPTLADLIIWQLLERLLVGAMELAGKIKGLRKVVLSLMALLAKTPYKLSLEAV